MATDSNIEIPWEFINTTCDLTNYGTAGDIVYRTDKVPANYVGILEDANVIFTTAGGGVRFQKRHKSGGFSIFTDNFTTTTTGINAIISAGDKIEVALSSTGTGVVDLVMHGKLVRTRLASEVGYGSLAGTVTEAGI